MPRLKTESEFNIWFWNQVNKNGKLILSTRCWEWMGCKTPGKKDFYGQCRRLGKRWMTHRLAYTLYKGDIPPKFQIDHLCKNTLCLNPDHLDAVTPAINILRSSNPNAIAAFKNSCKHGHLYTPETTHRYFIAGIPKRMCKVCSKLRMRVRRANIRLKDKQLHRDILDGKSHGKKEA